MNSLKLFKNYIKLAAILAAAFLCIIPTYANNVSDLKMHVCLHDNGSATITQLWEGTFTDGTENYIPIDDKTLNISNFNVAKYDGEKPLVYEVVDNWDINASLEDKSYRCGINKTDKGVELCFGISDYGQNKYVISYEIDPVVKSYTDYDGFNFRFINPNMSTYPTRLSQFAIEIDPTLNKQLSTDNARVWAFGYNGNIDFANGYVVSYSNGLLDGSNNVTVMLKLNKDVLHPTTIVNESFQVLEDKAMVGSTYEETLQEMEKADEVDTLFITIFVVITVLMLLIPIILLIVLVRKKLAIRNFYKNVEYFRDIPNKGNISLTDALFVDFNMWNVNKGNIIGALIMRMLNNHSLEPVQEKKISFFGKENINTSLKLVKEPEDNLEKTLYDIISNAAGDDNILQEKELAKYAKYNSEELLAFITSVESEGRRILNKEKGYKKLLGKSIKDLTEVGKNELKEVFGLRKYLDEFTLLDEKEITDIYIWENLLVYATLFGLARKVLNDLKRVYPDVVQETFDNYYTTVILADVYCRSLYSSAIAAQRAMGSSQMAAGGFGGSTSIGGGGGFSGGGSGGGSR